MTAIKAKSGATSRQLRAEQLNANPLAITQHPIQLLLRNDGEFSLSRTARNNDQPSILLLTSALEQPALGSIKRLEHEYSLRDQLDSAWAARPLALESERGRPTLLLDDPGGELLVSLMGQPLKVTVFLRVAIGLAAALGRLHERGLIHKDIKPTNILANAATGEVWLTGFGIASRVTRERRTLEQSEVIAGTLAYMSPEQTGRRSPV